jgi:hypothetical protein
MGTDSTQWRQIFPFSIFNFFTLENMAKRMRIPASGYAYTPYNGYAALPINIPSPGYQLYSPVEGSSLNITGGGTVQGTLVVGALSAPVLSSGDVVCTSLSDSGTMNVVGAASIGSLTTGGLGCTSITDSGPLNVTGNTIVQHLSAGSVACTTMLATGNIHGDTSLQIDGTSTLDGGNLTTDGLGNITANSLTCPTVIITSAPIPTLFTNTSTTAAWSGTSTFRGGYGAAGLTYTVQATGRVRVSATVRIESNAAASFQLRWFYADSAVTGAPSAGTATAGVGTGLGIALNYGTGGGDNFCIGATVSAVVTGLTLGHTYWFDLGMNYTGSVSPTAMQCKGIQASIEEVF